MTEGQLHVEKLEVSLASETNYKIKIKEPLSELRKLKISTGF